MPRAICAETAARPSRGRASGGHNSMSSAHNAITLWLSPATSYSIQFEWICSISRRSSSVSSFIHRGWIADAPITLQDRTFAPCSRTADLSNWPGSATGRRSLFGRFNGMFLRSVRVTGNSECMPRGNPACRFMRQAASPVALPGSPPGPLRAVYPSRRAGGHTGSPRPVPTYAVRIGTAACPG